MIYAHENFCKREWLKKKEGPTRQTWYDTLKAEIAANENEYSADNTPYHAGLEFASVRVVTEDHLHNR